MRAVIILIILIIAENTTAYHPLIYAGLYERDYSQEYQNYYKNGKVVTGRLTELMDVLSRSKLQLEDIPNALNPRFCLTCRALTYTSLNFYNNQSKPTEQEFGAFLIDICTKLVGIEEHICRGNIKSYLTLIAYILNERKDTLTSDELCGIYLQHLKCSTNTYVIDFTVALNASDTKVDKSKEYDFKDETTDLTIVHLSDFHYDPYYAVNSVADCREYICCRSTSLPKNDSVHKAGKWGDYLPCDTPGSLVENICAQVAGNHKNIDLIYYTGDFADHFEYNTSIAQIKYSIEFITNEFKNSFGDIPVIMLLGNHDVHPANSFAPSSVTDSSVSTKWLYEFAADLWARWLPESALETFRTEGYYSFLLRPKLRIIALNNNICYTGNLWLFYKPEYLKRHLEWLRDILQAAESADEKVHILGHIPPSNSASIYVWNREYRRIVLRYAHIIAGQFNGHTHRDEFSIFYTEQNSVAVNVAWNGGSGTTYPGLNSNYRIYHANSDNFEIIDHETWIFNLTEANADSEKPPRWFKEYSFREAYDVKDLSPASMHDLFYNRWLNNNAEFNKFVRYSTKLSDAALARGCNEICLHKYFCIISMCPPS